MKEIKNHRNKVKGEINDEKSINDDSRSNPCRSNHFK